MLKRVLPVAALVPALGLGACFVSDSESTDPEQNPSDGFKAEFVATAQVLPFGNDLYLAGSEDGTLNIVVSDETDLGNPLAAMNMLDGFSNTASAYVKTTDAIDGNSIQYWAPTDPGNVVMVDVTNPEDPQVLVPGEDYEVVVSDVQHDARMRMFFRPLRPLGSDQVDGDGNPVPSRYMALLTSGLESTTGQSLAPSRQFETVRDAALADQELDDPTLEQVRQALQPALQAATAPIPFGLGYEGEEIAVIWTFQTQSATSSLELVADSASPQEAGALPTGLDSDDANPDLAGLAEIWVGFTTVPYYHDADNPLSGYWTAEDGAALTRFNPMPEVRDDLRVPLFVTVPSEAARMSPECPADDVPADGWPVVMFQHGITGNRSQTLGLADAFGCQGYAMVAIDHPLHGIVDPSNPLFVGPESPLYEMGVRERHFYMVDGEPSDPADVLEAGGAFDDSGDHYINIASTLSSRDNLRQSVADLLHLSQTVGTIANLADEGDGPQFLPLDADRKFFVGHSLGGIAGTSFTSLDDSVGASVLAMPGGMITDLLQDSPTFGPRIRAGLREQNPNLQPGQPLFENFFRQAQSVIDAGDPANYGAGAQDSNVFMIEVDGDSVVPNSATQYLADTVDLTQVSSNADNVEGGGSGIVRYIAGNHGSLLQPGADDIESICAFFAIQYHTFSYIIAADMGLPAIDVDGSHPQAPDACAGIDVVE